jgi:filamentous hemagglutinin family protein
MKPIHSIRILKHLRGGFGTAVLLGILIPQLAVANPLGPKVVSGQASFATQGKTLSVTNSDRAIINWQDFSIGNGELTRFIQPTATSAVLNRVIGNNPSAIYGALQSNGRVYLVNQNGIFMGPTATIDVNGLVASTLNITDGDFKAGRISFSGGPLSGKIENQGEIRTPSGGSIYLIAPDVTNSGVIHAPNGDILLAAGQQVSLVESTTPEIAVVVSAPENQALNLGRIIAEAGRIGIYGGLIRHRGIVSADSAVMDKTGAIHFRATKDITFDKESITTANGPKGGSITLQSTEGTTLVSGAVEAKGSSDRGGTIQLLGTRVGVIDAAQIDASGKNGGGTVLVGGDYQGKNPAIQNADGTYFGKDAIIKADAVQSGDGGKVILWGNEATRSYGSISARGGELSGDGGFVETSGGYLDVQRAPDVMAPRGKGGTWLLDPYYDLTITNSTSYNDGSSGTPPADVTFYPTGSGSIINNTILSTALASSNVIVSGHSGDFISTLTVLSPITWATANSLTLEAEGNIYVNAAISGSNLILYSANQPSFIAADITLSGNLAIHTMGTSQTGGKISADKLLLWGTGTYSLPSAINNVGTLASIVGGSFNLTNSGPLSIGAVTVGPYAANGIIATGNVKLQIGGGGITQTHPISAAGLELLGGGAGITLNNASNNIGKLAGNVGPLSLKNSGALSIGQVNSTLGLTALYYVVTLDAGGAITQTEKIKAGTLNTSSNGGTQLAPVIGSVPLVNSVDNYSATNTGAGSINLRNDRPLLTINGINNAGSGDIFIDNQTGSIYLNGVMSTNTTSGEVSLYAGGAITAGGPFTHVQSTKLFHASASGIGPLKTAVSEIDISNSGTGNIDITNTGALYIPWLSNTASGEGSGNILINNTGSVTTGSSIVQGYGNVTIIANSPLTIGTGGVTSNTGNITLTAGATGAGVTTDILTLNGPLTATGAAPGGNVKLSAGNEIIENSTITVRVPGGVITRTPNMNGSAPPPTPTCPPGQELVGGICQPITCPTGQQLVGSTCQAITCPTGQQLVGSTCQAITCPTGQQLVGNTCQAITCPTGQQLVGNTCQAITCPTGQQLVGNTCQAITCPTGQQLVGNLCQPIICTGGQVLVGNLCTCTGGQVFIGAGCQCPAGTIDYAGVCKTPSLVPGTNNGTVIYLPVTEELTEPLQVLVQSIVNAVAPSLFRTSGSPGGGDGNDPNKPKKNYCN